MEILFGFDIRDLALPVMITYDDGECGDWDKMICINILFFHVMFIWR